MEEQLKQYLSEFVDTLKSGGEYAMQEVPLFVEEYLAWGFWESIILAIIFLLVSVGLAVVCKITYKNMIETDPFDEFGHYLIMALSVIGSIISLIPVMGNILTAVKIVVAPRVYLIENLMKLIN